MLKAGCVFFAEINKGPASDNYHLIPTAMNYKYSMSFLILFCIVASATAQKQFSVAGTVSDGGGAPIAGASVIILNTNWGTITDKAGRFKMTGFSSGQYLLQVSAVGYTTINEKIHIDNTDFTLPALVLNEADARLDAVVVTAQKREEQLQNVPFSVTALSARDVKAYRLWNAKDITAIVPNLNSSNSGDERNVTTIRGIGTTAYDPAVATYIDGVNQFTLDTYSSQLADIERIEVLRGPQGTLYGRNAMGGVINIVTKQPGDKPTAFAEASFGNYNQQRYEFGFRSPLIKNKLYLGAAWLYNRRDGYYKNDYNNRPFDNQSILGGNYYLKYKMSPRWNLSMNLRHQAHRNDGAFPLAQFSAVKEALASGYHLSQNALGQMRDNTLVGSLSLHYSGQKFIFSAQTAYQSNYRYYKNPVDGDFSFYDIVTIVNNYGKQWNYVKTWTQEFKFASPAGDDNRLQWTAGAFLFADHRPNQVATHYGADAGFYGIPDTNFSTINTTRGKAAGIAFYGQGTFALTDKLDVTAGLRYDYEQKKYAVLGMYQKDGEDPMITLPDTAAKVHYTALSPKVGISWHFTQHHNLYAVYSRGFRTGGLTQLSSDPAQPPLYPYKPEYSNNLELGVKNNFLNNKFRANLALFYTAVMDIQVPTLVLPDAITITRNAGKMHSKGVELELAATPLAGFLVDYNFGYTEAKYKTLKIAQNGQEVDLKGNRQVYTPSFTSMLALQYTYPLGRWQKLKLLVRGEWAWLGRQYFDLANQFTQPAYSLLNARLGVQGNNFDLLFWGRNIGGKKYVSYAYDFGAMHLGDPRTCGVSFGVRI